MKKLLLFLNIIVLFVPSFSQNPVDELNCGVGIELRKGFVMDGSVFWPSQVIPFYITDEAESARGLILQGISRLNAQTNVCIVPRKNADQAAIKFYTSDNSVSTSSLGYQERGTTIHLSLGASERTIQHEIIHSLGFHHEHQRPDRDEYIIVNIQNANPDYTHAFSKIAGTVITPYDYSSIMHYHAYAFSINGSPTLRAINDEELGSVGLTEYDIQDINHFYPKKLDCDSLIALFPPKPRFRYELEYGSWCKGYELHLINESTGAENYQSHWEISNEGRVIKSANTTEAFFTLTPQDIRISLILSNDHGSSESSRSLELKEKKVQVNINPNPIAEHLRFTVDGGFYTLVYNIWDVHGNILHSNKRQRSSCEKAEQIEVRGLASGIYLLRVEVDEEVLVKRFRIP